MHSKVQVHQDAIDRLRRPLSQGKMRESRSAGILPDGLETDRPEPGAHGDTKVVVVLDDQNAPVFSRSRHGVQSVTPDCVPGKPSAQWVVFRQFRLRRRDRLVV